MDQQSLRKFCKRAKTNKNWQSWITRVSNAIKHNHLVIEDVAVDTFIAYIAGVNGRRSGSIWTTAMNEEEAEQYYSEESYKLILNNLRLSFGLPKR